MGEDPKNLLLFASFQAEGTLGKRIQKGWNEIPIGGNNVNGKPKTMQLKIQVDTIEGLSGHSDRNQLLNFIQDLSAKPDKVIVCHGESSKAVEFARAVHKIFRVETYAPRNLESIRLK